MKLPILLPKEFDDLRDVEDESELFSRVASDLERAVAFMGIAGDDETWCDTHPGFVRKYLQWLTELFYRDQLNIELAVRIKNIIHAESRTFSPHMYEDMTLKLGEEEIRVNSLLLAAASPYFLRLVRQMVARKERALKLTGVDVFAAKSILEMVHRGSHHLWKKEQAELERVLLQAKVWELDDIAEEAENLLIRYVKPNTAEECLIKARKNGWFRLEEAATVVYNHLEIGLKLHTFEPGVLIAEFLDLKGITSLAAYRRLSPLVSICKFTGSLASDPDFLTVLSLTPKLMGLDFTESDAPPYSVEGIPSSLRFLSLKRASWASDEKVVELISHLPELSRLDLQDLTWIGLPVWGALSSLRNLVELNLAGLTQLKDEDLALVSLSPTHLERLSLAGCKRLSPLGLQQILRAAPRLIHLDLSKTAVSDQNLAEMGGRLSQLEELNLSFSRSFTEKGLISFLKQRPSLKSLLLEGTSFPAETLTHLAKLYPALRVTF